MPLALPYADDVLTVTVDGSNAGYPTAVAIPPAVEAVLLHPVAQDAEWTWDSAEGADIGASVMVAIADTGTPVPVPRADYAGRKRHVVTVTIDTALTDQETITIGDSVNTDEEYEADPSNNGLAGSGTEIGTNASTAADQAAGIVANILAGSLDLRAEVDPDDSATFHIMGTSTAETITVTLTASTGAITVKDRGMSCRILYIASDTAGTVVHVAGAAS